MSRFLTIAALAAAAVSVSPAQAVELACGERTQVVGWLNGHFGESQVGYGVLNANTIFELHVSSKGTWTLVSTDTRQQTCILAAGSGWEASVAPQQRPAQAPASATPLPRIGQAGH